MKYAKTLMAAAGCAMALACAGLATPAVAADPSDVLWNVTGVFDDGGTLSGHFYINVYGYIDLYSSDGYSFVTTAGTAESGFEYNPSNSYSSADPFGPFVIEAQPGYQGSLHLTFLSDLVTPSANNPLIGGFQGPTWECVNSYSCYLPEGGTTRYLTEGHAYAVTAGVPEPATWALMIGGFSIAGAAYRLRRRPSSAA